MSYDLLLFPKTYDAEAIRNHFASRKHYEIGEGQVFYSNDDTDVYFLFDLVEAEDAEDAESEDGEAAPRPPHVAFNLNYNRPHVFALEAEPEVTAFEQAFDCAIEDPQIDGMGEGPYAREAFLSGWTKGNQIGVRAISQQMPEPPLTADPAQIEEVWAWNLGREELQRQAGDNLFVPKVVWVQPSTGAAPVRCITWTFGVPTLIPEMLITHIVLVRQERPSLLKMLSRQTGEAKTEVKLLNVETGIRLRGIERGEVDGKAALFTPLTGPLEVQALFSGAWPKPTFQVLPTEAVLGSDFMPGQDV